MAGAASLLRQVLAINPTDNDASVLFALVCARTGKRTIAVEYLRNALKRDSTLFEAQLALSTLLFSGGATAEAVDHGERSIALRPEDPDAYFNLGKNLFKAGGVDQSLCYLEQAHTLGAGNPAHVATWAAVNSELCRYEDAAAGWRELIQLDPLGANGWIGLGRVHLATSDFRQAAECARRAIELDGRSADAHMLLAMGLSGIGEIDPTELEIRRAIELNPRQPSGHGLLGWILQEKGRFEEADQFLRESIRVSPASGMAYYALARSHTDEAETHRARLEQMAQEPRITPADRSFMAYTLGKVCEDRGEFEAAMRHFDLANKLAAEAWFGKRHWDRARYVRSFDQTIELFGRETISGLNTLSDPSSMPLLVVGMIRSGTTLVEQILSSHPDVAASGEMTFWHDHAGSIIDLDRGVIDGPELARAAQEYLVQLSGIGGGAQRVTDKMPHNFAMLGIVHGAFPNARILHVRRDPLDTCLSIYTTPYGKPPAFAHNKANIVCAYLQYLRMVSHWRSLLPADRFLEVNYEELVRNREATTRRIVEFAGLPWDDACLHHDANPRTVNTPSAWQVRQPVYRSSVGRWRNFEPWLGEFNELRRL